MTTLTRILSSFGERRNQAIGLAGLIAAAAILGMLTLTQSTHGGDIGDIRAAIQGAIEAEVQSTVLPPGSRAGHLSASDRQAMQGRVRGAYARYFAGTALTTKLSSVDAIVDRMAADPSAPHLVFYRLVSLKIDDPIIAGNSATVTGQSVVVGQTAWDWPDGRTATVGGTSTASFAFQMERIGGHWVITFFTEQPADTVDDPALDANLEPPAPEETKSIATEAPHKNPPPAP